MHKWIFYIVLSFEILHHDKNTWLLIKLDYWNIKAVLICTPLHWFLYHMVRLNAGCLVVVSKTLHVLRFTHVLGIVTISCRIMIKADWVFPELSWLQRRYMKNYSHTRLWRSVILFHLFWRNCTIQRITTLTIATFIEVTVTSYRLSQKTCNGDPWFFTNIFKFNVSIWIFTLQCLIWLMENQNAQHKYHCSLSPRNDKSSAMKFIY